MSDYIGSYFLRSEEHLVETLVVSITLVRWNWEQNSPKELWYIHELISLMTLTNSAC